MEDVAGYRVLRVVGLGARSRVLLGFADGDTAVLKVCRTDDPRVRVELEALERAAGEHVVELRDVSADEASTVLVLERLAHGTLAELLERRSRLSAGEAVTILAPLATALARIHAGGVAHGALALSTVGFRDDGAPVLFGFGGAEIFAAGAPEVVRETIAGVRSDREAFRALVALVLGRVSGAEAARRRLLDAAVTASPEQLATALFDLAAPTAVGVGAEADDDHTARVGEPAEEAVDPPPAVVPPWILAFVPDGFRERVVELAHRLRDLWASWNAGRRRLVLGGGAAGLTVVLAVALEPGTSGTPTAGPADPVVVTEAPEVDTGGDDLPDDPVAATVELLERRERCLRELSALCLDGVVQPGSAAQSDDVALVRAVLGGEEYPRSGILDGMPVLVERLGDSALIDLPEGSAPASVLLMRTREGWRLRQYLDNPDLEAPAFSS